jgi:delta8-fatty-acid desaturase
VTQVRKYDHLLSTIIANIFGGISVGLWKDEHQTHHLMTNHVEHDPDIQLIPFVATSNKFFKGVHSSFHNTTLTFGSLARFMVKL